jgi:hypothetical protein
VPIRGLATAATLLVGLLPAPLALATELRPGGGIPPYEDQVDYYKDLDPGWIANELEGPVLASRTTPFELSGFDNDSGLSLLVHGSLRHWVVRETQTGLLSFHYAFGVVDPPDPLDFDSATFRGFDSFFTDVRASAHADLPSLRRSADGDSIWYAHGESFGRHVIVRTNAPDFAEGGEFTVVGDWVFTAQYPSATLATFRPVPEPAAFSSVLLIGAALLLRWRGHLAAAPPRAAVR